MKTLQIVTCAYRATTEEQDDTVVWICHAMRGAGAEMDVLLRGNAVNYAVAEQNAAGLIFGDWKQTHPANPPQAIAELLEKGVGIYAVDEDAADRGLKGTTLVDGVRLVVFADLAGFLCNYDRIWQW